MKVLLLGGTGAMGVHLKDLLSTRGDDVFITSRKKREDNQKIHYIHGNAHDVEFLNSVLYQKWDSIIDFMVYSTEEFKIRMSSLLESTTQYIFISSSRVYANTEIPICESSPRLLDSCQDKLFLSTDEYSLKKARQEDLLLNSGKKNYTIVRPYITYSENRLQLGDLELAQWLPRALDGRTIVFSKDIAEHYTTLTYGYDVANGIVSLIGNVNALGEVYHITCGKSLKWKEILSIYLDTIERITGKRPAVKWTEHSAKLSKSELKYQILYDRTFNRIFDNSKILKVSPGLKFTEPAEGLARCVEVFALSGKQIQYSVVEEARRDRLTGEIMRLNRYQTVKHRILYIMCRFFYYDKFMKY